jgi:hypothetical protein
MLLCRAVKKGANRMTTFCERCRALRSIEDWREAADEMMSIMLGPCGHVIHRHARLEWHVPARARLRLVRGSAHKRVAMS